MSTPVYGESSSTGGSGTVYRYITAAYCRQAAAGPCYGYFCGLSYGKGYGAVAAGSLVQASLTASASPASTTNLIIYKNQAVWFTALSNVTVPNQNLAPTNSVSFAPGVKTYAAGDQFDVYLDSTSSGLYFGVTLLFAEPGP